MSEKNSNKNTSFLIEVKSLENSSWQGRVTWVEEKKSKNFRSALELIKLMDSVLYNDDENTNM